jgi:hypothetical protein
VRLRRQLQNARRLALSQQCEQHDGPVGKLESIVMRGRLVFVDLAEDRRLMIDGLGLPISGPAGKQATWPAKASSVPGIKHTAVPTSLTSAKPRVPVPKSRVTSLSPTFAGVNARFEG